MKPTVLIIDDNQMIQLLIKNYLSVDFDVRPYSNAVGALQAIQHGDKADLIVTDLAMPGLDGQAFLQKLKKDPAHCHIPVLILSGNEKSETRISCLLDGAEDFVQKPFHPEELKIRIKRILN